MNKAELTGAVVERCHQDDFASRAAAERAVDAVFKAMADELAAGGKVTISNFGSFEVVQRAARQGRKVNTNESILIPAHKAVRFNVGRALKDRTWSAE